MDGVGEQRWAEYHARHGSRVTWVVMAPMTVELLTAGALAWRTPSGVSASLAV